MKTYSLILVLSVFVFFGCAPAQNKNGTVEASQAKAVSSVEKLVASKKFEFIATTMYPMGQPSKNLVGNVYTVSFSPEKIVSELPYYGVAHRAVTIGKDKGMRFEGEPQVYSISESKNGFSLASVVNTDNDSYSLSMEVSNSGYAMLTINSNNRGSISYRGEVR